jgi:N-acetylgalactosamine kinase
MPEVELKDCLITEYRKQYNKGPLCIVIAPGRVNLIGEHIDYNGFGVLPCAIGRFTLIAVGEDESESPTPLLSISHVNSQEYPSRQFALPIESIPKEHHWTNYVLAAYLGLKDYYYQHQSTAGFDFPSGVHLSVSGNIPHAAGLSSSSSLVVAAALAFCSLCQHRFGSVAFLLSPEVLADICMKCEWYVGTAGGGMDQSVILLSQAGFASHIQFLPSLNVQAVPLPPSISFIVANSLTRSAKAETAPYQFNKRFFECKIGTYVLRKRLAALRLLAQQDTGSGEKELRKVDIISDSYYSVMKELGCDFITLIEHCKSLLPPESLTKDELLKLLSDEEDEIIAKEIGLALVNELLENRCGREVWEMNTEFYLQNRAIHVYSEAMRVEQFVNACKQLHSDSQSDNQLVIQKLAFLLNESDLSCNVDYDCSCPKLRQLTDIMRQSGCLAARLTGAGWGGCAVGMVRKEEALFVMQKIKEGYYQKIMHLKDIPDEMIFGFEPVSGASIINIGK